MDHLAMKHFRDKMVAELRTDKPLKCPRCDEFESKDKQNLFRHMISKHKVLDHYLAEAIEKMKSEGKQPFNQPMQPSATFAKAPEPIQQAQPFAKAPEQIRQPQQPQQSTSASNQVRILTSTAGTSSVTLPQFTLPSFNCLPKTDEPNSDLPVVNLVSRSGPGVVTEPVPSVPLGASHVTLAEFMDSGLPENGNDKIMQVDGAMSCESDSDTESVMQVDGTNDGQSDSESTGLDSEMSMDDRDRGRTLTICPVCKEGMRFSKTHHFAVSHFRPRLTDLLPKAKPFSCPECGEVHQHKMNLMSHYLGRHKKLDQWLQDWLDADPKPDWCDPSPPTPRSYRKTMGSSASSSPSRVHGPGTPPRPLGVSTPERGSPVPVSAREWFCNLCHGNITQRRDHHYATYHFREKLRNILPTSKPFLCPDCDQEAKHFLNLSTHYLTQHGYLAKWMSEIDQNPPTRAAQDGDALEDGSLSVLPHHRTNDEIVKQTNKHDLSSSEGDYEDSPDSPTSVEESFLVPVETKTSLVSVFEEITSDKVDALEEAPKIKPRRKKIKKQLSYDILDVIQCLASSDPSAEEKEIMRWSRDLPPAWTMTKCAVGEDNAPPHNWLCEGKLLVLTEPNNEYNFRLFQRTWVRGLPILFSNITNNMDMDLWHPKAFLNQFGSDKHDLINCKTGKLVPQVPLKWFWQGFMNVEARMLDNQGMPMLLKLKDWPPEEDFAKFFPQRFEDMMKNIPMPEYTRRDGRHNLASYMPDFFVRPDLGPKMYIAYGSALYPEHSSTNLHLDMTDAVNIVVYVGVPEGSITEDHITEGLRAVDEAGCDMANKRRVRQKGVVVGALWHIYHPRDADKIRDFLNKRAIGSGKKIEPHTDPIHDQSIYLDGKLRKQLFEEYGVVGCAFPQCEGDSVFIPAGAPHQVRNINNCIKVAEDFVSPEGLEWTFLQSNEFRELSDSHTNHEDKLQVKNILFHAVKDCVSILENYEMNNNGQTC